MKVETKKSHDPKEYLGRRVASVDLHRSKPLISLVSKEPDFDSVLHKVLYCVILKQFNQHFDKKI